MKESKRVSELARSCIERMLILLIHLLVWGYVLKIFLRTNVDMSFYFALISLFILSISIFYNRGWFRMISVGFLIAGVLVLLPKKVPFWDMWQFFGTTTNILTLLILAPFFSIPIHLGAYYRYVQRIVRNWVRTPHSIYFIFTMITYLLSALMSVAAIVATYSMFRHLARSFPKMAADKIIFSSLCRGHMLAMTWSPVGITLGVALARVPADPGIVICTGLSFSIFAIIFDTLMFKHWIHRRFGTEAVLLTAKEHDKPPVTHWCRVGVVGGVIVFFIMAVIILHEVMFLPVIDAVILLILSISLIWSLLLKKPKRLIHEFLDRSTQGVLNLLPQLMLFISVGFFTKVLIATDSLEPFVRLVSNWSDSVWWLLILLVVLIAVVSSQIGLYPALVVMMLADLVPYEAMGIRQEWFVFAITAGAVIGGAASPLTMTVNIVSNLTKNDPIHVARSNLFFAVYMSLTIVLVSAGLNILFPV